MSWEDQSGAATTEAFTSRRKFDDEEEEVLDDWEAAEDSDVEREKEAKAAEAKAKAEAEAAANKKSKAQRIEEQKQKRAAEAEAAAAEKAREADPETQASRAEEAKRAQEESDFQAAQDLFAGLDVHRNRGAPKGAIVPNADGSSTVDLSTLSVFKPNTKADFDKLSDVLVPLISTQYKKADYPNWAADFVKQLMKDTKSADIKKAASVLTTASNEKLKEERAADKGTKKSKAAKTKTAVNVGNDAPRGGGASRNNLGSYGDHLDYGDDDDDFM